MGKPLVYEEGRLVMTRFALDILNSLFSHGLVFGKKESFRYISNRISARIDWSLIS